MQRAARAHRLERLAATKENASTPRGDGGVDPARIAVKDAFPGHRPRLHPAAARSVLLSMVSPHLVGTDLPEHGNDRERLVVAKPFV